MTPTNPPERRSSEADARRRAEERANLILERAMAWEGNNYTTTEFGALIIEVLSDAEKEGFREGQEKMRERASEKVREINGTMPSWKAEKEIRAMSIEEPK